MNAKATKSNVIAKVDHNSDQQPKTMNKGKTLLLAAATAVASLLGAWGGNSANAAATTYTLQDGNSSSQIINPDGTVTTQNGMLSWMINSVNQINQQWFSYRIGDTGETQQLDQLTPVGTPTLLSTDGSTNNYLQMNYASPGVFSASITYLLSGGQTGSGTADMSEIVKITNTSSSTLNFHLFQYTEYALGGGPGNGETVSITGNNTATVNGSNSTLSQTVVSPHATEVAASSMPTSLEDELLNTPGFTVLSGPDTAAANPGVDSAAALEWDIALAPGSSLLVSEDNVINSIPEPASGVALLGLGGLFLMRSRRRDEDPDPRTAQVAEA